MKQSYDQPYSYHLLSAIGVSGQNGGKLSREISAIDAGGEYTGWKMILTT